ncbi:MAG TPA: flippase [Longimicrobiaceae bacterium]
MSGPEPTPTPPVAGLTRGSLLARNAVLNLLGQGAPMLVALVAIPVLIAALGTERFGVLTLIWVVIGYFSLLDLGLGRALTHLVAEKLGAGREEEIPALSWTALALVLALGAAGGLVAALLAPWLILEVAHLPAELERETVGAMYLLALSLPAVASTAALRGILEAAQRFDLVNALRVPLAAFLYAGPLLVLPFSNRLVPIVGVLLVGRLLGWAAHLWMCLRTLPQMRRVQVDRLAVPALIRFGSWATVSNLVSPLMVYLDRFLIGGMVSVAAVAYYVTPYEVVTKLWVVPYAVVGVLFPAVAAVHAADSTRTGQLFRRSLQALLLVMFPVTLVLVTLAPEALDLWLGAEFARNSAPVLRWLAIGVFVNSLAQVPYTVLQGMGRPDLTGKLHLLELPLYLVGLWLLVGRWGIVGAAAVWVLRIGVDTVALFALARQRLGRERGLQGLGGMVLGALALLLAGAAMPGTTSRLAYVIAVLVPFAVVAWRVGLRGRGRQGLLEMVRREGAGSTVAP